MPRSMDIRRPQRANINLKPVRPEGFAQNSIRVNYRKSPLRQRLSEASAQPKVLPDYFREGGPIHKSFSNSPRKKKSSWATIFIILLLLLVGAAIAGFFIFGNTGLGGKSLKLSLELPEKAVAGEDFTLSLTYRNLDKVSLTNSEIVIEYPENFYFTEATLAPINPENNVWRPEPIGPGEEKKIEIKGYLIGEIGEQKEFKVIFHYQPENFNSTFQEDVSQTTTISSSALAVVLESPAEIDDGAVTQLKVRVKNNSSTDLDNLALSFDLGEAFKITEKNPSTTADWLMEKLKPGEEKEFWLKGKIDSTLANPFKWSFGIWQKGEGDPIRYFYKKTGTIKIKAPQLSVSLILADERQPLSWGNDIIYKVQVENLGEYAVKEATLKLNFISDYLDWDKFNNQGQAKIDTETNSLTYTAKSGTALAERLKEIKPGDKIEATIALPLQNEPADLVDLSAGELAVDVQAALSFKSGEEYKVFSSEHLVKNITTQLKLIAEARYYLDQETAVGSGPLPPAVGQETRYRIYWKLFSGPAGLKNVVIKTTLPAYVVKTESNGEVTIGSPLKYNDSTREVIWSIDDLAANSLVMAVFDVGVTPEVSQVNQLLILINPTILEAGDGEKITKTVGLLTSDLTTDPVANGKGRVTVQ